MIGLVTTGTVLGYLTRNAISVAAPTLQDQLHITTQQYSYIVAAYSACYTIMQPIAGYVLDLLGTKIGYAMFAILWAVFCMGTALANSWEMAFIITGALSMVWAICWLVFYKHPKDQKKRSDEERDYILSGQEAQHQTNNAKKMSAWQILRNRQFWGIALPRFLAEPAWGTFNAWIPLFMFKAYGFNLKEIAMFAWMPMLFADIGCILGNHLPMLFQKYFKVNLIVSR